jgi:hypothetical protein
MGLLFEQRDQEEQSKPPLIFFPFSIDQFSEYDQDREEGH